jgi:hypothetical protein
MLKVAGTTDNPNTAKKYFGHPEDWKIERKFGSFEEALTWSKQMEFEGYTIGANGDGWKYGYTFTKKDDN